MAYVTSRSFSSPLRAAFLAFLIIPSTLADRTFWVDSSCDGKIDGAPEEVVNAAKLMFNRLNGEPQEAALNALKTVFNVQADDAKSSLAYAEVLRVTGRGGSSLSKFTKEALPGDAGRKNAEVRIYCDNDKRWKLREDDPDAPDDKKNSNLPKDKQEYVDKDNAMVTVYPGCLDGHPDMPDAETYYEHDNENNAGQNPWRTTITLCDRFLKSASKTPTMAGLPTRKNLGLRKTAKEGIDRLAAVISMTLFHEFMHHLRWDKKDKQLPGGGLDSAYGWENCLLRSEEENRENADTFALLAVIIMAMERKFALKKDDLKSGVLYFDEDLPAAPLRRRAEFPVWERRDGQIYKVFEA